MKGGSRLPMDALVFAVLLISSYTDLRRRKIYNLILFPAVLLALVLHIGQEGPAGLLYWGKGLLIGTVLLLLPFLSGGLGAGDVKLLGVVGAMKGAAFAFNSFLFAALLGGVGALALLIQKRQTCKVLRRLMQTLVLYFRSSFTVWNLPPGEKEEEAVTMPYGVVIALGTVMAYLVV